MLTPHAHTNLPDNRDGGPASPLIDQIRKELLDTGCVVLAPETTYSIFPEWRAGIPAAQELAPGIDYNDIHSAYGEVIWYSRSHLVAPNLDSSFWRDKIAKGEAADELRRIFTSDPIIARIQGILPVPAEMSAARFNRMHENDMIGRHTHGVENIQVILTLKEADAGGEYYFERKGLPPVMKKFPAGTLVINQGQKEAVEQVKSGERFTLVYTFSTVKPE